MAAIDLPLGRLCLLNELSFLRTDLSLVSLPPLAIAVLGVYELLGERIPLDKQEWAIAANVYAVWG